MKKVLIPLAAAAATLAIASPASAQYYPQPVPYGAPYAAPYAQNSIAVARTMQARVQNLRAQIRGLDRRNLLTRNQARTFDRQARTIERQVIRNARYGLNPRQRISLDQRIARLELRVQQRVAMNMRHGNRYAYGNRYYGGRR